MGIATPTAAPEAGTGADTRAPSTGATESEIAVTDSFSTGPDVTLFPLAPVGIGFETYTTDCDLTDDPYSSCI